MTTAGLGELARFAASARRRAEAGYYGEPPPTPARAPPLARALRAAPRGVVAELKPASPTAGALRTLGDPGALARRLAAAGARGVSVLSDADHFGGSLEALAAAAGSGAPVLMKDFVVAEAQLDAARACGASAVLLILPLHASGAAWAPVDEAVAAAHARGLEVLLEVYDAEGFRAAQRTEADVLGVNNRDLRDLTLDAARFPRLMAGVAKDRPVMALSGVEDADGARRMFEAGADAVLVGTALMRADDPVKKLEELTR